MIGVLVSLALLGIQAPTMVAVFPVGEKTGERDPEFAAKLVSDSRTYLGAKFKTSGYELLEAKKVDDLLLDTKFDANDRDQWTTNNLMELGRKLNAPQVVFAVVIESGNGSNNAFFSIGGGATGTAKVRIWLIDVLAKKALIRGQTFEGNSSSNAFGDLGGSKGKIIRAVQLAMDKGLNDILKIKSKS